MDRPNILFIFSDQFRGDFAGFDGNPIVQTPYLDHLATTGTRFRHAYAATPSCIPARASLWSGQSPWHTGILGMGAGQGLMPNDFPHTLAGELTKAGYHTKLIGTGHFHPYRASMGFQSAELTYGEISDDDYHQWFRQHAPEGVDPMDHGIPSNSWLARPWHTEEYLHPTAWAVTRAKAYLRNRPANQPFFLNLSFQRPHAPYAPPAFFFDLYDREAVPAPHFGEWCGMHDHPVDALDVNAWRGRKTDRQIHRARAGYCGEISFLDNQIGRLLNWIFRVMPEILNNTWILFMSDHGDMLNDHNLWRKTYAYEGSARVPFLVRSPNRGKDYPVRCADAPVTHMDVMPTVLDIAGAPIPRTVDGRSVLPLMRGEDVAWREYLHGEHSLCYSPEQEMQYVTDGRRKYIWFPRIDAEQFFDLDADPGECRDLSAEAGRRDEVAFWRGRLVDELAARDCGWVKDGRLHYPQTDSNLDPWLQPALISPWRDRRWTGEG